MAHVKYLRIQKELTKADGELFSITRAGIPQCVARVNGVFECLIVELELLIAIDEPRQLPRAVDALLCEVAQLRVEGGVVLAAAFEFGLRGGDEVGLFGDGFGKPLDLGCMVVVDSAELGVGFCEGVDLEAQLVALANSVGQFRAGLGADDGADAELAILHGGFDALVGFDFLMSLELLLRLEVIRLQVLRHQFTLDLCLLLHLLLLFQQLRGEMEFILLAQQIEAVIQVGGVFRLQGLDLFPVFRGDLRAELVLYLVQAHRHAHGLHGGLE